jgi:hypothetical protein
LINALAHRNLAMTEFQSLCHSGRVLLLWGNLGEKCGKVRQFLSDRSDIVGRLLNCSPEVTQFDEAVSNLYRQGDNCEGYQGLILRISTGEASRIGHTTRCA